MEEIMAIVGNITWWVTVVAAGVGINLFSGMLGRWFTAWGRRWVLWRAHRRRHWQQQHQALLRAVLAHPTLLVTLNHQLLYLRLQAWAITFSLVGLLVVYAVGLLWWPAALPWWGHVAVGVLVPALLGMALYLWRRCRFNQTVLRTYHLASTKS